jgi:hypothetical protein
MVLHIIFELCPGADRLEIEGVNLAVKDFIFGEGECKKFKKKMEFARDQGWVW